MKNALKIAMLLSIVFAAIKDILEIFAPNVAMEDTYIIIYLSAGELIAIVAVFLLIFYLAFRK